MLSNEPWIKLGRDIRLEYEQNKLEGLDAAKFEKICVAISELDNETLNDLESSLEAIEKKMSQSPPLDNRYCEPSNYYEILKTSPANAARSFPAPKLDEDTLRHKIKGAWLGRMAGCLLGKPVEGYHREILYPALKSCGNYPLQRYMRLTDFSEEIIKSSMFDQRQFWANEVDGISPSDDDTNYTVLCMKIVENYGRDFTAEDVMHGWLRWLPYLSTCTAERVAYRNAAAGMLPPETALYKNPYREWIGAQIRADFYGYINPGDPVTAAEMAFRDASISHVKNGIYGAMFVAAMLAAAAVTDDINAVINAGLSVIPEKSRLRENIDSVREYHTAGLCAEEIIEKIHCAYNEHSQAGWCYTNSNAMVVTMALLCGEGDFGKSICLAVQAAFDTDCNGATVGSVVGMLRGDMGIPDEWTGLFGGRLKTAIDGYNIVDAEELTKKTMELMK